MLLRQGSCPTDSCLSLRLSVPTWSGARGPIYLVRLAATIGAGFPAASLQCPCLDVSFSRPINTHAIIINDDNNNNNNNCKVHALYVVIYHGDAEFRPLRSSCADVGLVKSVTTTSVYIKLVRSGDFEIL